MLRRIQAMETAMKNNANIVVPTGSDLVNVLGEMAGIVPLRPHKDPYDKMALI